MPPLLMANWREINRAFCALCWMAALVLAVVIVGHFAGVSSASAIKQSARTTTPGGPSIAQLHPGR